MRSADRLAAAQSAVELLGQVNDLVGELERRRTLETAEEFTGRAFLEIEGVYTGKAGDEEGLMIEGVAADWTKDREGDAFEAGAFDAGIEKFMENPILVYSHSKPLFDTPKGESGYLQLGIVKELRKDPVKGLLIKAFVRKPAAGAGFLETVYDQIKNGEMKGMSVGGMFKQVLGKIIQCDLTEVSVAPRPVNHGALITRVTPIARLSSEGVE